MRAMLGLGLDQQEAEPQRLPDGSMSIDAPPTFAIPPSPPPSQPLMTAISFRVCIITGFDELVRVTGSCSQLGNWEPQCGLELFSNQALYPCWVSAKPVMLALRQPIEYKYAVLSPTGTLKRWEAYNGNRFLTPTGTSMCVEDDNGYGRQVLESPASSVQAAAASREREYDRNPISPIDTSSLRDSSQALGTDSGQEVMSQGGVLMKTRPRRANKPSEGERTACQRSGRSLSHSQSSHRPLVLQGQKQLQPQLPSQQHHHHHQRLLADGSLGYGDRRDPATGLCSGSSVSSTSSPSMTSLETSDASGVPAKGTTPIGSSVISSIAKTPCDGPVVGQQSQIPLSGWKRLDDFAQGTTIEENDTVVVASFALPVKVARQANGEGFVIESQKSLVIPSLHGLRKSFRIPVKFVGWPGLILENDSEREAIEELLEPLDCIPVYLSQENLDMFLSFCHKCLWALFHNVVVLDLYTKHPFDDHHWGVYQAVNRLFAEAVIREAHETDLIWIHDYHLLLAPQFITRRVRKANVGLFLHTPFPSSEVFRCLPVREELLRGMLCADLIGFQFFEYARHFLVINKRLLGMDHHFRMGGFLELDYAGRSILIHIGHVHIQYDDLRQTVEESKTIQLLVAHKRKEFRDRFVIASVDRCERLAGMLLKLRGFQHLLRNYAYTKSKVVLVQYAYPTVLSWDRQQYAEELYSLSEEINREFSKSGDPKDKVLHLEICSVSPELKYALFQVADCFLETSVRDGLNLSPFEFICCRKGNPAPIILSEFTGCCRTLASATRVNPWKCDSIARAIDLAINTTAEELQDRFLRDELYLQSNSTLQWAEEFLLDLRRARKKEDLVYVSWGFGTSYRVFGMVSNFQYLDSDHVVQCFRQAKRRVFFLDHEGTLAPDRRRVTSVPGFEALTGSGAAPSKQIKQCLRALCSTPGTTVVIVSGRDRSLLEEWFGGIPGIGLCAEHGYYLKVPKITGHVWKCTASGSEDNFTWKEIAMELMRQYVKRTQGAFIENKGSALVFQYRDADPEFGAWQAKELANYLEELLFGCPLDVVSGKGYVEVKLKGVSKGQALQLVLKHLAIAELDGPPIDFILCIGDDRSDEEMFPVANKYFESEPASKAAGGSGLGGSQGACGLGTPLDAAQREQGLPHQDRHPRSVHHPGILTQGVPSGQSSSFLLREYSSNEEVSTLQPEEPHGAPVASSVDRSELNYLPDYTCAAAPMDHYGSLEPGLSKSPHSSKSNTHRRRTGDSLSASSLRASGGTSSILQQHGFSGRTVSANLNNAAGFSGSKFTNFSNHRPTRREPPFSFSVTVGKKPSNARYYLNSIEEVSELLQSVKYTA